MNVAIFGASGATGRLLTGHCLAAGYNVTALVRTPANYPGAAKVRVVQGDAFDRDAIARTLDGADAVFSALGARSPFADDQTLERGVPLIVAAMLAAGVKRIVALGSAGALDSSMDLQAAWQRWLVKKFVYRTLLRYPVRAQKAQYAALQASSLDWTMVMPPVLTNEPARGTYRVAGDALPPGGVASSRIARADVAEFMFRQLGSREWVRKGVYLTW
jgi:putative NADH-flavin reductase